MTDKEIIKALECCITSTCISNNCPYEEMHDIPSCFTKLSGDALDLINRQQAEIERLNIRLRKERHQFEDLGKMYSEIRTEAIKEILDRVDAFLVGECSSLVVEDNPNFDHILFGYNTERIDAFIDNLKKEMVGEDDG